MSKNKNPFSDEGWEKITDKIKKEKEGDKIMEEQKMEEYEKELNDYDKDLYIDIDQLEIEWLKQPHLYKKYSTLMAEASLDMDVVKAKLETTKAVTDDNIRDAMKLVGEKITERVVESQVLQNETYMNAVDSYNKRKYEYTMLSSAVKAIEQRKSALENLVKLALGEYFAAPQQPRSIENIREIALESLDEKVRSQINKKRRKRNV